MRIDSLVIENFKRFSNLSLGLHPQFTLFVGDNGAGKTSVLDALAIAAGVWLVDAPDSMLGNSGRNIYTSEIRLESRMYGDRILFREKRPVVISATGRIGDHEPVSWTRQIRPSGTRTSNAESKQAIALIQAIYARDAAGEHVLCPVLAYYGAGRAWLPSNQRVPKAKGSRSARRWAAFYDCFSERIRFAELQDWFRRETIERGNRGGRWRPGFEAVRRAILKCVPDSDDVRFDTDRDEIVLSIGGNAQPFDNLSAGQRMMLALVADLAVKAVTQNSFLLPPEEFGPDEAGMPRVLTETPGVVLIDELDVHLHPKWQRQVAKDLKETFPHIQFVCTSHSPQVLGELSPDEIRIFDGSNVVVPRRSFGIDSSRILEEVMGSETRNSEVRNLITQLFSSIDQNRFEAARGQLSDLEAKLGADDPDVTRARSLMSFLESPL
jgi:predicted ATP-binding protein involved in virulence